MSSISDSEWAGVEEALGRSLPEGYASDDVKAEFPEFELPEELALSEDSSEDEFFAILQWANPGLPDPRPDPYERGLTAAQVDETARSELSSDRR